MKYFIKKGFDENIRSKNGSTALHSGKMIRFDHFYLLFPSFIASVKGHLDIVNYLIEKGSDGNIQDNDGLTALHCGKMTRFYHFYLLFLFFFSFKAWTSGYCEILYRKRI